MASSPPAPTSVPCLSDNDALVLNLVFDPESVGSSFDTLVDPAIPPSLPHTPPNLLQTLQSTELAAVQPLNVPSPPAPLIQRALAQLTDLITAHPTYASAYNNRAQTLRLLVGDDLFSEAVQRSSLWSDLCQAIALATPAAAGAKVSTLQGSVLSAAHAQRGHLLWEAARSCGGGPGVKTAAAAGEGDEGKRNGEQFLPESLRGVEQAILEEMASKDFEIAGRYGDRGARKVAASTNPYARLCGSIVREAMKAEIKAGFSNKSSALL
ncbi:hypothetical protein GP486_007802 [Trichoglossum hirsutum]|uniref:Uncharacterized protein n=1 Tax=Trichoglossum hirsutum TaxID=265104 RepID=A0A9P8IH02_9PEZI|nr:hypothetical protein GP486_007802 [Trichoglossum hirsutum]